MREKAQQPSGQHHGRCFAVVRLPPKVWRFFTHRRHADRFSMQHILAVAVVAYIMGDLEITPEGYRIRRATTDESPRAFIEHPDGSHEALTLEDAELTRELVDEATARPSSIGLDGHGGWGTREVAVWLSEKTGKPIGQSALAEFLNRHYIKPPHMWQWIFSGPDDPLLPDILARLERYGLWGLTEQQQRLEGLTKTNLEAAKKRHGVARSKRESKARRSAEQRARKPKGSKKS